MTTLIIKNFSCIDSAEVDLSGLTVLIGPQASGKSVISKLLYFFHDLLNTTVGVDFEFEEKTIDSFSKETVNKFQKNFPPQAWGVSAFEIIFLSGPVEVRINRAKPRGNSVGTLRITFSEYFKEFFSLTQQEYKLAAGKITDTKSEEVVPRSWEISWKVRQSVQNKLKTALASDFVQSQLFIPAGRSFFTSMGKAVVAFEHGGFLDPLTIQFGKLFLAMRDHLSGRGFSYRSSKNEKAMKEITDLQDELAEQLFSGKIKVERNEEYIETPDGRKIPFSIMSSGQQELLPLWLTVNYFVNGYATNSLVYIEEPEAHLFPSAQGVLIEYLVSLLGALPGQKMLITTHSPYILSKVNNLLKAGSLAEKSTKKAQAAVEAIVPRRAWLTPGNVSAYAIVNRKVVPIMEDDGFIDGDYLDSVSGDISRDFNELLEIEYVR